VKAETRDQGLAQGQGTRPGTSPNFQKISGNVPTLCNPICDDFVMLILIVSWFGTLTQRRCFFFSPQWSDDDACVQTAGGRVQVRSLRQSPACKRGDHGSLDEPRGSVVVHISSVLTILVTRSPSLVSLCRRASSANDHVTLCACVATCWELLLRKNMDLGTSDRVATFVRLL